MTTIRILMRFSTTMNLDTKYQYYFCLTKQQKQQTNEHEFVKTAPFVVLNVFVYYFEIIFVLNARQHKKLCL